LCAPFEISGDASFMEAIFEELVGEVGGVCAPLAIDRLLLDPCLQVRLDLCKIDENMFRLSHLWSGIAVFLELAFGIDEFGCIDEIAAAVALVTPGIMILASTPRTCATDEPISEELLTLWTILLLNYLFKGVFGCSQCHEDFLGDFGLNWSRSSSKELSITVEPLINLLMDGMIFLANLCWSQVLLYGFGLSGCAVLVSATNENRVVVHQPTKPGVDVRR